MIFKKIVPQKKIDTYITCHVNLCKQDVIYLFWGFCYNSHVENPGCHKPTMPGDGFYHPCLHGDCGVYNWSYHNLIVLLMIVLKPSISVFTSQLYVYIYILCIYSSISKLSIYLFSGFYHIIYLFIQWVLPHYLPSSKLTQTLPGVGRLVSTKNW